MDKITVRTVPNGYILVFKNEEYFYFSRQKLLEGIMYHVGLEELGVIDPETIGEFLAAVVVWKDNAETVKELIKVKKENATLNNMVASTRKQVRVLREKLSKYEDAE